MARISALLMAVFLAGAGLGACTPPSPAPQATQQKADLDSLFVRLKLTDDQQEVMMIEAAIRHAWSASPKQEAGRLMSDAIAALHHDDYETALDLTDEILSLDPRMPAAWNLRATLHYMMGEADLAAADAAQVLRLEPRHFGAWSGLGRIMLDMGDKSLALRAYDAALAINPHLSDLAEEAEALRAELSGRPI